MKKKLYHLFGGRRVGRNDKFLMQAGCYHHVLGPLVHEHTDILLDAHWSNLPATRSWPHQNTLFLCLRLAYWIVYDGLPHPAKMRLPCSSLLPSDRLVPSHHHHHHHQHHPHNHQHQRISTRKKSRPPRLQIVEVLKCVLEVRSCFFRGRRFWIGLHLQLEKTLPETTLERGWLENKLPFEKRLSGRCELFVSGRVSDIFLCRINMIDVHSVTNCGLVVWTFFERGASCFYSV